MRRFNTAGPCEPSRHYMIPPLSRLPEAFDLVDQGHYFALHAPRQTGKTTTLRALARELIAAGKYAALCFTCEEGEPAGDDYEAAQRVVMHNMRFWSRIDLPPELRPPATWPEVPALGLLGAGIEAWAAACPRPLVLFFDEIDALRGESLRTVLRQLRAGFPARPESFAWSIVLCGLRDVRDYKTESGGDTSRLGTSSPFNVKVESPRLGDFSEAEVRALYGQHTEETGQIFSEEALVRLFDLSQGQPWLTNALGREVTEKLGVRPPEPITIEHVEQAKERLILERATHLDSLAAKLQEPRVRKVLQPILAGETLFGDAYNDDLAYVRDLGLVSPKSPLRIANPIYKEVIVRVLSAIVQENVTADPRSFVLPDRRLDFPRLLAEFVEFWKEHGELLEGGMSYHEVAPQLVLMGFLQRIVNGGGTIDREYGVGRGRIDLYVRWPYEDAEGKHALQREAVELKVWAKGKPDPLAKGLVQLEKYLERLGLREGVLVIFDRRPGAGSIEERIRFEEAQTAKGYAVTVLRA
jgi:DNA polymerase III delta prime subunit